MPEHTQTAAGGNLDVAEIAKFDAIADRWWRPDGEFRPLHELNPLRVEFVAQRAPLDGAHVLDAGCGGGILSEALARRGAIVTGIDASAGAIAAARSHAAASGLAIDYRELTCEALAAAEPQAFDLITCMELVEHVPEPASLIGACARLVRPGGDVFFSTINRGLRAYLTAIVAGEYLLGMLPRGTHDYDRLVRPSELAHWCRAAGLELLELTGMHYSPVTRSYTLGPGVDVNYLAHCRAGD